MYLTDCQMFFHEKFCIFYNIISKTIRRGNFEGWFFKTAFPEKLLWSYTQMVISEKVRGVWSWFWYQIKAESAVCCLHWYQNLTLPKMSLIPYFVGVYHMLQLSYTAELLFHQSPRHRDWTETVKSLLATNISTVTTLPLAAWSSYCWQFQTVTTLSLSSHRVVTVSSRWLME